MPVGAIRRALQDHLSDFDFAPGGGEWNYVSVDRKDGKHKNKILSLLPFGMNKAKGLCVRNQAPSFDLDSERWLPAGDSLEEDFWPEAVEIMNEIAALWYGIQVADLESWQITKAIQERYKECKKRLMEVDVQ